MNILFASFKLYPLPGDVTVNGRSISKLEHADDLVILSTSGHGFQAKLNGTTTHMGNIGCEIQTLVRALDYSFVPEMFVGANGNQA
jgi:hypothetical protein